MNAVATPIPVDIARPPVATTTQAYITRRVRGLPTSDGAGVKLTRVIGTGELPEMDPFLLLDAFGTDEAADDIGGFPDHPHRGFETVTYMLDGRMRHRDNHGHEGLLVPGSVQWMTAGRGLIHSEMPEQEHGRMRGFQLWINLPASDKMTAPRYQEFAPDTLPIVLPSDGVWVKLIAGEINNGYGQRVRGPIVQPATDPLYLDIRLDPGRTFCHDLPAGHAAFVYVFEGEAAFGQTAPQQLACHQLGVLGGGARVSVHGQSQGARLLLVAGRPLHEPIARHGPFVMNTREQLMQAFADYQHGRF